MAASIRSIVMDCSTDNAAPEYSVSEIKQEDQTPRDVIDTLRSQLQSPIMKTRRIDPPNAPSKPQKISSRRLHINPEVKRRLFTSYSAPAVPTKCLTCGMRRVDCSCAECLICNTNFLDDKALTAHQDWCMQHYECSNCSKMYNDCHCSGDKTWNPQFKFSVTRLRLPRVGVTKSASN